MKQGRAMRLRSITKHIKDQNWAAVVLDFFIVVAGILIAFQITNWNVARQDDIKATRLLERLEQDFVQQLEQTDLSMARHKQSLSATSRLIEGVRLGAFDEEALISDVYYATEISTPPGSSNAFQELVSSGQTGLIRSETLRRTLYEYNSSVSFVRTEYSSFTAPVLQAQTMLMPARMLYATGIPSENFTQLSTSQSVDSSILIGNPEILTALQASYQTQDNIHLVLGIIRNRIKAILTLIKIEQERAS